MEGEGLPRCPSTQERTAGKCPEWAQIERGISSALQPLFVRMFPGGGHVLPVSSLRVPAGARGWGWGWGVVLVLAAAARGKAALSPGAQTALMLWQFLHPAPLRTDPASLQPALPLAAPNKAFLQASQNPVLVFTF